MESCHQQGFYCVANPSSGRTAQPQTQCTAVFKIVWLLFLNCCILTMLTSPLRFTLYNSTSSLWLVSWLLPVCDSALCTMASWVTTRYRSHLKDLLKMASLFFLILPVSMASAENSPPPPPQTRCLTDLLLSRLPRLLGS